MKSFEKPIFRIYLYVEIQYFFTVLFVIFIYFLLKKYNLNVFNRGPNTFLARAPRFLKTALVIEVDTLIFNAIPFLVLRQKRTKGNMNYLKVTTAACLS